MPLMGSFYVGLSGLQTGQNALNTTAHNLSNIDTEGYTRQQTLLATRRYNTLKKDYQAVSNQEIGLGVLYAASRQVRDVFLDKTFRKESGRSAFYEVQANSLEEVENLLGEMEGENFQKTVSDLWTAVQELAKDPGNSVNQGLLVQSCSAFVDRSKAVYQALEDYQNNLNRQVYDKVTKINEYGKQLVELNDKIRQIEITNTRINNLEINERANDLRDTRNAILDELSKLCDITFEEAIDTNVSVQIEGIDFVKMDRYFEIGLDVDETTGFYTPYWPQNAKYKVMADGSKKYDIQNAEVFDLTREISSDLDTDIGELKSILLARGDHRADYTDIKDANYKPNVSQSIVMNVQGEFDQMVHNIVTAINDIMANTEYMKDVNGEPLQMFKKITTDGYVMDTDPTSPTYNQWVLKPEDEQYKDSLYTVKNLMINVTLQQNPGRLSFRTKDQRIDYDTAEALKLAFTEEKYNLNPNVKKTVNFIDYYQDLVAQVANSGYVYRAFATNQEATVEAASYAREQIVGVASDEELSNMIRFQNAYNASSRYINVIDEMLEHLIDKLG
ncbi:MAG: flagellar hook-associated protein FlgK [Lachnospiraceae bacterium]|nr:flagellar hook-associated protein FlgK [Lachnospiraceae bacterium]MBP5299534.1 flagellar hook-associated protein FlgK [Lachnospiraceae bacterium]